MSPAGTVHANWNHYAMSYDSTTGARRFYINGANVGSNTVSYANAATWTTQAPYLLSKPTRLVEPGPIAPVVVMR